jgi:putative phosphoribosyl transferase
LLIVGEDDEPVVELNRRAFAQLRCKKQLKIVPGATHLFAEPGALEQVANLASRWFQEHLAAHQSESAANRHSAAARKKISHDRSVHSASLG